MFCFLLFFLLYINTEIDNNCLEPDALISCNLLFIKETSLYQYIDLRLIYYKRKLYFINLFSLKRVSVMYKTIFAINIIIYMCLQHSNVM